MQCTNNSRIFIRRKLVSLTQNRNFQPETFNQQGTLHCPTFERRFCAPPQYKSRYYCTSRAGDDEEIEILGYVANPRHEAVIPPNNYTFLFIKTIDVISCGEWIAPASMVT